MLYTFCIDVLTTDKDGVPYPDDVLLRKRQDRVWWTFFIMIGITTIALLINLFIKEDLRRLNYDKGESVSSRDNSPVKSPDGKTQTLLDKGD